MPSSKRADTVVSPAIPSAISKSFSKSGPAKARGKDAMVARRVICFLLALCCGSLILAQTNDDAQRRTLLEPPPPVEFAPWKEVESDEFSKVYDVTFPSAFPSGYPENDTVRLRAFGVPERLVTNILAIGAADDERWNDVVPHAGFMVGTSRGLRSVFVVTAPHHPTT